MRLGHKQRLFLILAGSLIFWAIALIVMGAFSSLYKQAVMEDSKDESQKSIALVRANFEAFVFQTVYTADSLATIIMLNPQLAIENWETIAKAMVDKSKYIRNVGIAPDNIVTHVYPLLGNEKVLGFDMRDKPSQYASAMRAKELQEVYLDGPLELVQGGHALIVRFPIFLDAPQNNDYWGTVSVVLNYELILKDSGIYELDGLEMAMRRYYKHLKDPIVFYGSPALFSAPDLVLPILLPNSRFEIAGSYELESHPSITWRVNLIFAIGIIVSLGLYVSGLLLLRAYSFAHEASLQDELTKLPNRRFFMSFLDQRLSGSSKPDFALLNVDLNDFKLINDTYGHDVGDQFLQHVARLLVSSVRSSDFVARLGGDEFVVILDRITSVDDVNRIISKIRESAKYNAMAINGVDVSPSFSIGMAICSSDNKMSVEEILVTADKSMYSNKLAIKSKK